MLHVRWEMDIHVLTEYSIKTNEQSQSEEYSRNQRGFVFMSCNMEFSLDD